MEIGPALGGIILAQWTAHHRSVATDRETLAVYAEKDPSGKGFLITRGYDKIVADRRVLVVEDILTTGGSARGVVEAVRAARGIVIGVGVLVNRGGVTLADLGHPSKLEALVNVQFDAFDEAACTLCAANVPINTTVGKGREYLARKAEAR